MLRLLRLLRVHSLIYEADGLGYGGVNFTLCRPE